MTSIILTGATFIIICAEPINRHGRDSMTPAYAHFTADEKRWENQRLEMNDQVLLYLQLQESSLWINNIIIEVIEVWKTMCFRGWYLAHNVCPVQACILAFVCMAGAV